MNRHVFKFDMAMHCGRQLAARRLGFGLHQLGQQLQRQYRLLILLHQPRGLDQRVRQPQPQHVERDQRDARLFKVG